MLQSTYNICTHNNKYKNQINSLSLVFDHVFVDYIGKENIVHRWPQALCQDAKTDKICYKIFKQKTNAYFSKRKNKANQL
jgi:hypothetical protein